jgi:hypothetical protein
MPGWRGTGFDTSSGVKVMQAFAAAVGRWL